MRKITTIVLSLFATVCIAQEVKFIDLASSSEKWGWDNYTSYISKNGIVYKVGDKLTVGTPSANRNFNYVTIGESALSFAPANYSNTQTEIIKIKVVGNDRQGRRVLIVGKGTCAICGHIKILLENAIESGELKSSVMSSDEALTELKKAKDKLDLGLISQAKYDSLKIELAKFIK